MKLYCMCQITGDVPRAGRDSQGFGPIDSQIFMASNRYGHIKDNQDFRPVLLGKPMTCIKNGIEQEITVDPETGSVRKPPPNLWAKTKEEAQKDFEILKSTKRHHPNVDLYRCPICGAEVVIEG